MSSSWMYHDHEWCYGRHAICHAVYKHVCKYALRKLLNNSASCGDLVCKRKSMLSIISDKFICLYRSDRSSMLKRQQGIPTSTMSMSIKHRGIYCVMRHVTHSNSHTTAANFTFATVLFCSYFSLFRNCFEREFNCFDSV